MFRNQEIFTVPVFAEIQQRTADAIRHVNQLPESTIRSPSLAGEIDKLIERYAIQIPELRPADKKGKRRVESRRDGYGHSFERTLIDVTIPTTCDAGALRLQPSHSPIFQIPVSLNHDGIVVSLPDSDGLTKEIDDFVARLQPAIEMLKREAESHLANLRPAVERAVQQRLASLKAQDERDSKRGFPID